MEKINIAELLKDCPKGMELDCTICNGVKFVELDRNPNFPIVVRANNGYEFTLTKYGQVHNINDTKCVIFPKGKTTWEGFVPPCEFKKESEDDERMWKLIKKYVHYNISDMALNADHITREQLESWLEEQDKKELMNFDEAEKEKTDFVGDGFIECHADFLDFKEGNTYWLEYIGDDKYNVRSDNLLGKTYHITPCQLYTIFKKLTWLEKQDEQKPTDKVEPKFKVGDRIRHIVGREEFATVVSVKELHYNLDSKVGTSSFSISLQHEWELAPNKFDINTLIPFESRVLVRDYCDDIWRASFWGCLVNSEYGLIYDTTRGCYKQCIPYEGNEHLLGNSDDCAKHYKNWK